MEFDALRREIEYRSNAQLALISLNLTAIGALAGFALSEKANNLLLILIPVISVSIGLLYLDHGIVIQTLGLYIRDELGFKWEKQARQHQRRLAVRLLLFGTPILLMFIFIPVGCLFVTLPLLLDAWTWMLWILGVFLALVFISFWISYIFTLFRVTGEAKIER